MDDQFSSGADVVPLHRPPGKRRPGRFGAVNREPDADNLITSFRWLTRAEAADYLGIHPRTLANWAAVGRGPRYSKPSGTSCMYRLDDLHAYLQAHMVHTEDQPEAA